MQQIQRGIFIEDGFLGVTLGGLVYSHGAIMIDAPLRAEDARSWRSALMNQRGGANRLLVYLDAHPDRTLGARALDTTIVAHQKTAQVFRNRPTIFKGSTNNSGAMWETYSDAVGMRWATPDITFSQRMSLHWGGPEIVLEHHPGPAPGAIWVVIPADKVIFIGDLVTPNQPPFLAHADAAAWLESLDALLQAYSGYTMISGRGGVIVEKDVHAQKQFLQTLMDELDELARRSLPPDATQDLIPDLLGRFRFTNDLRPLYEQRLRYGLHQFYNRRYRAVTTVEETEEGESE